MGIDAMNAKMSFVGARLRIHRSVEEEGSRYDKKP